MNPELLILGLTALGASALQAATGIGFGVIAGPVLLAVMNDNAAIQVSVILNLLIALLLAPSLWRASDQPLLRDLLIGLVVGSPLGLFIFLILDTMLLKVLAGLVVLFALFSVVRGMRVSESAENGSTGRLGRTTIGVVAGLMGGSLAMPGPVPAAWMAARGFGKDTIRATILVMFVFAYGIALVFQATLAGISADTLKLCAMLTPSTAAGVLLGRFLSSRISERTFRLALAIILLSTVVVLFTTLR